MHPCSEGITDTVAGPSHSKLSVEPEVSLPITSDERGEPIFRAGVRVLALNSWERMRCVIFCLCSCLYLNMRGTSAVNQAA